MEPFRHWRDTSVSADGKWVLFLFFQFTNQTQRTVTVPSARWLPNASVWWRPRYAYVLFLFFVFYLNRFALIITSTKSSPSIPSPFHPIINLIKYTYALSRLFLSYLLNRTIENALKPKKVHYWAQLTLKIRKWLKNHGLNQTISTFMRIFPRQ